MSTLHEKIATLPPSLLPVVERFVDSLPRKENAAKKGNDWGNDYDPNKDPILKPPPEPEEGKPRHPQPGCMKGTFIMSDNFFEPDDVWEEYM